MSLARLSLLIGWAALPGFAVNAAEPSPCPKNDSGLTVPAGFCASIFADDVGRARHLVVSPAGVVYVNTLPGRDVERDGQTHRARRGFLVALKDTHGAGQADVIRRFGESSSGGAGGTGIGLYHGGLYAEIGDRIVRYELPAGALVPRGAPRTVVSGLPLGGDHPMHPFAIDADGSMYVDVASATNSCQVENRMPESPGVRPCVERETRGGIWKFDANARDQVFSPSQRYATGIRNGEGIAIDGAHRVFVTQHGRDQLHANWPRLYRPEEEATLPAEEVVLLTPGGDYGWPMCYFDGRQGKLVLAPEFGGDGGKAVGECATKTGPVAAFPAHWAPDDMQYVANLDWPARFQNGLLIAFHGSWDRAPYEQQGFNVVFQSLNGDAAGARCEIFADGFAGVGKASGDAMHRPAGLAVGPEGSLYVADDRGGRIYRIRHAGGAGAESVRGSGTACPRAVE